MHFVLCLHIVFVTEENTEIFWRGREILYGEYSSQGRFFMGTKVRGGSFHGRGHGFSGMI